MDGREALKKNVLIVTLQSLVSKITKDKTARLSFRIQKAAEVGTWQGTSLSQPGAVNS